MNTPLLLLEVTYTWTSWTLDLLNFSFKIIRPHSNSIFNVTNSVDLTYLNRLHVGLSDLLEQKFRHNFWNSLNPIWDCGNTSESNKHYLLHCSNFRYDRYSPLQNIRIINFNLLYIKENVSNHLLTYGDSGLTDSANNSFLNLGLITLDFAIINTQPY